MKTAIDSRSNCGAITWILLTVLVVVIVAAAIAVPFLPRSEAPDKPPAQVRAKIPSVSEPAVQPKPQAAQVKIPPPPAAPAVEQQPVAPKAVAEKPKAIEATTGGAQKIPPPPKAPDIAMQSNQSDTAKKAAPAEATASSPSQTAKSSTQTQEKVPAGLTPSANVTTAEKQPLPVKAAAPPPAKVVSDEKPSEAMATSGPVPGSVGDKSIQIENALKPFTIQVGAFRTKSYAENLAIKLKRRGYDVYIFEYLDKNLQSLYMVRLGHYDTRQEADAVLEAFKKKENMTAVVARSQQL